MNFENRIPTARVNPSPAAQNLDFEPNVEPVLLHYFHNGCFFAPDPGHAVGARLFTEQTTLLEVDLARKKWSTLFRQFNNQLTIHQ